MAERITPRRFHEHGWRIVRDDAASVFIRTGSFEAGVAVADAISRLPDAADHRPDVDLRAQGVTVRLRSDRGSFSESDLALAAQISSAARELGAAVDPSALQRVQVAIDALVIPDVLPFWRAVLGYEQVGDEALDDPLAQGPPFWFQQMDAPRPQRNRIHIDVYVPHDQAEARVAAAIAAGGRVVRDRAPDWWTLADPEDNEVDIAPWPDLG